MRQLILPTIKEVYGADGDDILEVDVSYDGTWMTRGHKFHVNVGFVILMWDRIRLIFWGCL